MITWYSTYSIQVMVDLLRDLAVGSLEEIDPNRAPDNRRILIVVTQEREEVLLKECGQIVLSWH